MKLKIAMIQLDTGHNIKENLAKGLTICKNVQDKNIDIIVFPEMWSTGYFIPQDKEGLNKYSISKNSDYIKSFQQLAKELGIAILTTYLENKNQKFYNSACLIDMQGKIVFNYQKVHTCDFGEEKVLTSGNDFYVESLLTKQGEIKIGTMICYDREFPESARIIMLKGAELILVPNACPMEINRISQLRGRAYENMLGIVTVNYPITHDDCNGHSTAFDGIAYKQELPTSRDTLIFEANENAGIYIVEMPIDEIREYRKREVHGNAYRRPEKYHLLINQEVNEPFIRIDKNTSN